QSDLAFLRDRSRNAGFEVWVEKGTLHAQSRPNRATQSVSLTYGEEVIAFSVRADLAHQCSELHVTGWDVAAKQAIDESSTAGDLGGENKGSAGGSFLSKIGVTSGEYIGHSVPITTTEAKAIAKA